MLNKILIFFANSTYHLMITICKYDMISIHIQLVLSQKSFSPFLFHLFYVFVYLDINRGKPCLVNLILSKLFLTGSLYVCSANFILIRFNLILFRKCLTSINPNIVSFNFKSSKCHVLNIAPR